MTISAPWRRRGKPCAFIQIELIRQPAQQSQRNKSLGSGDYSISMQFVMQQRVIWRSSSCEVLTQTLLAPTAPLAHYQVARAHLWTSLLQARAREAPGSFLICEPDLPHACPASKSPYHVRARPRLRKNACRLPQQ